MLYCFNQMTEYNSFQNEIRVIGVYEASSDHTKQYPININLQTCSNSIISKPLILFLNSYEAVNWSISSNDQEIIDNLQINTIQALAYKYSSTSISVDNDLTVLNGYSVSNPYDASLIWNGARGYGDDNGGGKTAPMLYKIPAVFGDFAYSFIGQYKTSTINVCVGDQNRTVSSYDGLVYVTSQPTSDPSVYPTTDPTDDPTTDPTNDPTTNPTTQDPSPSPSIWSTESLTTSIVHNLF